MHLVAWFNHSSAARSALEPFAPPSLTLAPNDAAAPRVALCGAWNDVRDLCGLLSDHARVTWYGDPQVIGHHDVVVFVESRLGDAFPWLRELRRASAPILVVTSGESSPMARALSGAVCIGPIEDRATLVSRVLGLASHGSGMRPACPALRIEIDFELRSIRVGDTVAHLTRTELLVFDYLARHAEQWKTANDLLQDVLGNSHCEKTPVVRVHVFRLRRALGEMAWCIESHQGKGYRFTERRARAL